MLQSLGIALEHLNGVPAKLYCVYQPLNGLLDMRDGMLYAAGKDMGKLCLLALLSLFDTQLCRLLGSVALQRADLDDLAAQLLLKHSNIDFVAVLSHQVHHIDSDNHRQTYLNQLCGQIQVTLNVRTVDDVQDDVRFFLYQIVSGYDFLKCVRAQGIDTRKVLDDDVLISYQTPFLLLYRYARPVTNVLVAACQIVKQCCFAAVRISCKRNFN